MPPPGAPPPYRALVLHSAAESGQIAGVQFGGEFVCFLQAQTQSIPAEYCSAPQHQDSHLTPAASVNGQWRTPRAPHRAIRGFLCALDCRYSSLLKQQEKSREMPPWLELTTETAVCWSNPQQRSAHELEAAVPLSLPPTLPARPQIPPCQGRCLAGLFATPSRTPRMHVPA